MNCECIGNIDTIVDKIAYFSKTTPDKICIIESSSGNECTYKEFWKKICIFASNIDSNQRYILQTSQSIDHLVAYYGIQVAGSVAIPIEHYSTQEIIEKYAYQFDATIIPLEINNTSNAFYEYTTVNPDSISCILCTTGTTGNSKGVMSSFRSRFYGADNVRYSYDITSTDVAFVPQALSHSGGLRRVEAMLISGATVVIAEASMLFGNVFCAIKKYNCNILQFVPAQVSMILKRAEKMLVDVAPQLRIVSVGSAVISETDKERLRELLPGVRLFNDFGSTEAIGSAYFEWSAYEQKQNCVGRSSLHSNIVFLDDSGKVITEPGINNPGIIATEGGTVMSGYYGDPELTREVLKDGRYISSDLGYLGDDGMIYILGRRDDIIVCGTNKISPLEVENKVLEINGIIECACVPREDRIMGHMPVLFIVCDNDDISPEFIRMKLAENLDKNKIPRCNDIFFLFELPKTKGTGKVLKRELIERLK